MMDRAQIINEVKKFFDIDELVCDHTYQKYRQDSWRFLDTDLLHCLLIIRRDIIKKPIYANGRFKHQRGLRCNMCDLVKTKKQIYLSAHVFGKAVDFEVSGMTAEQARQAIMKNAHLLPCKFRMESGVSWVHLDVMPMATQNTQYYLFKA